MYFVIYTFKESRDASFHKSNAIVNIVTVIVSSLSILMNYILSNVCEIGIQR